MVWKYSSSVLVDKSAISLWQLWRVWTDMSAMPKWDKDCEFACLETTLETGNILTIIMKNKPGEENKCVITRAVRPDESSPEYTGFHFVYAVPLAEISFEYEAVCVEQTGQIRVSHSTVVSGLLSGLYVYALKTMIKEGCDHMTVHVPPLAASAPSGPDSDP